MNKHYHTNFEKMRIPTLRNIHMGITHKVEVLQEKMAQDMGRTMYYDILPRNYEILPMEKCSLHDVEMLDDLCTRRFECFWTLQKKEAEEKNNLADFEARFKFYSYINFLTDNEINEFYLKCQEHKGRLMSSHDIILELRNNPQFIEEVMV